MNLNQYQLARQRQLEQQWQPRAHCSKCQNPECLCYCSKIRPFSSQIKFVILIHRGEARRSIATGRMAHLIISNSQIIEGLDYSEDSRVNTLIEDPNNFPVLLYPGIDSLNLSQLEPSERQEYFPTNKKLVVFILDGTWSHAKRMKRLSRNLCSLPKIQFTPQTPSNFRVREQPHENCYSTIEATHELILLLDADPKQARKNLLEVFDFMVDQTIHCQSRNGRSNNTEARQFKETNL